MISYTDILDTIICPKCGHEGMVPDGDLDYICPVCEYEGTLEDDEDDEDDA